MKVIVGSTALHRAGVFSRIPSDLDIWTDEENYIPSKGEDVSLIPTELLKLVEVNSKGYATPESILTIKMSHLGYDIFFNKHKRDILALKYLNFRPNLDLYATLVAYWKKVHGNKDFLSLYKDKTEFFNDFVDYQYEHDYLHELVAYPNEPMYNKCLISGQDVAIDKVKFFEMSHEDQVKMFREEIAVIALERWLLVKKFSGKIHWTKAWKMSLRKTITNLTKNWVTEFIVKNLEEFCVPDYDYFDYAIKQTVGELNMGRKIITADVFEDIKLAVFKEHNQYVTDHPNGWRVTLESVEDMEDEWESGLLHGEELKGFELLEEEGGGEGGAEDCYSVFSWKGVTYKVDYSYYSHHGYDDDSIENAYVVTPQEKTIIVWE